MKTTLTVDILEQFISGLDLSSKVLSFDNTSEVGTTFLTVENTFNIRAIPKMGARFVLIDGVEHVVNAVDHYTNVVTIASTIINPQVYKVKNPFFFKGTPKTLANEITDLQESEKLPFVFLWELLSEKRYSKETGIYKEADVRLILADLNNFEDWTRADHYTESIFPLEKLADFICDKLYEGKCVRVDKQNAIEKVNNPNWGVNIDSKGNETKIINDDLDAIGLRFKLQICECG